MVEVPREEDLELPVQIDETTQEIYDIYRKTVEIYERTIAALGRKPRYRVTMNATQGEAYHSDERGTTQVFHRP